MVAFSSVAIKFRDAVSDCILPDQSDNYLLTWLKARDFDLTKAEFMLRKSLKWREFLGVDLLTDDWRAPEVFTKFYTVGFSGYDKEGNPVWIFPLGRIDLPGFLRCAKKEDYVRYSVWIVERSLRIMRRKSVHQHVIVFDMEGFSFRKFATPAAMELYPELIRINDSNYPETLKKCVIINASKASAILYNMVKHFFPGKTAEKVAVYDSNRENWVSVLLEMIDPDQLPVNWGGTRTDPIDGNPYCSSQVLPAWTPFLRIPTREVSARKRNMGIRGLESYIKWKAGNCYREEPLRNLRKDLGTHFPSEDKLNVLVDGSSFLYMVYSQIGPLCWLYHIDWFGLECEVRDFARQLESYGFRPIFFFKRDYDCAIADDPSELSFIKDRLKLGYEHTVRVYDLIRVPDVRNLVTLFSNSNNKLLSILASSSRTYLKELGYEVQVGVGGKPSLALYAKNPRNKIAAILSDNTDFLVLDLPCPTFRIQNIDFTRGTLEKMDSEALKQNLGVQAQALPVMAALLGDTGIGTSKFLKIFWEKHSLINRRTMRHPDVEKVARFAKDVAKDRVRMQRIAAELPLNYFQSKLDFYNLEPGSEADTTDCEKNEEDGWSQILHFAQEQMTHIPIFRDIYEMLKHCQHQVRDGLEDHAQGTLPVSSQLLQPVLRRLYGYLYRERPTLPDGRNQVHEYSTAYVKESEGEKLVEPLPMEDNYPPPSVLWKLPADGTMEDWEKRCGLLMAILVPSLWQHTEKCHQVLELLRELPGQLTLTVLMVIWFQSDKEYSMYEEMTTEGLLWQACWVYKKGGLPNEFQRMTYDTLDATVVHFSNFFGSVSYVISLLLAAVGYPIPWQETMPWKFYHGPIFAYYCMKRADPSTVDDVDGDIQKYVAQMKQVISVAC